MNQKDLDYLQADLARAQASSESKVLIKTAELQAVLSLAVRYKSLLGKVPKPCGYVVSDELRNLCDGQMPFAKIRRYRSKKKVTSPVYFLEIEGQDTREEHLKRRAIENAKQEK